MTLPPGSNYSQPADNFYLLYGEDGNYVVFNCWFSCNFFHRPRSKLTQITPSPWGVKRLVLVRKCWQCGVFCIWPGIGYKWWKQSGSVVCSWRQMAARSPPTRLSQARLKKLHIFFTFCLCNRWEINHLHLIIDLLCGTERIIKWLWENYWL